MVAVSELRRKVIIEGEERGVRQTTESVTGLSRAHVDLGRTVQMQMQVMALERRERMLTAEAVRAQRDALREMNDNARGAANSNEGGGFKAVVEGAQIATKVLLTAGTVAVAAGVAMRGLSTAMLFLRVGSPVLLGLQAFNMLWSRGKELVEQYTDAHRKLDRSDLTSNLTELTKFQTDQISADQVQYATELGSRLKDAHFTIGQFWKVQLDVTNAALGLQEGWVRINETIAAGTLLLPAFVEHMQRGAAAFNRAMGYDQASVAEAAGLKLVDPATVTQDAMDKSRQAAYGQLKTVMGVANIGKDGAPIGDSFSARFGDNINALKNYKDETKEVAKATTEARNAWDRATDSLSRHIAQMNADAEAVGKGVGAQARLRAEAQLIEAGMRAGMTPELVKASEAYKRLGDNAEAAAIKLERARINDKIGFDRNTMFLPEGERQIASELRSLYGDVSTALQSSEAAALRLNQHLTQTRDITIEMAQGFARDFVNGIRSGETAIKSLERAGLNMIQRLADKLIDMGIQNLVLSAFGGRSGTGGLLSMFSGAGRIYSPNELSPLDLLASANGNVFANGRVQAFASGGIIGGPMLAPMALMGEAGPEAIVPLKRGSDGKLGVSMTGAGNSASFVFAPRVDARGADQAAVARLTAAMAQQQREFERNVLSVMKRAQGQLKI